MRMPAHYVQKSSRRVTPLAISENWCATAAKTAVSATVTSTAVTAATSIAAAKSGGGGGGVSGDVAGDAATTAAAAVFAALFPAPLAVLRDCCCSWAHWKRLRGTSGNTAVPVSTVWISETIRAPGSTTP